MLKLEGKRVHFMGIGGIGMSSIAQIAAERGAVVDGCDLKKGGCVQALIRKGYQCLIGHSEDHISGADIVVHSSAVPEDCPELVRARELGLPVLPRSHMLAHLMQDHRSISVVGSHGKTTTTWLISYILMENGLDPTVMLGGNVSSMNGNFRRGSSEWFVSEIDESDGLPEGITSFCTVLTNIDDEHTRWYGSIDNIKKAFGRFLSDMPPDGTVVVCADDKNASEMVSSIRCKVMTYGLSAGTDVYGINIDFDEDGAVFDIILQGRCVKGFRTNLPGRHNIQNALASIAVASLAGIAIEEIKHALAGCPRVERRMNVRKAGTTTVIDDYGHHPTEVRATLEAISSSFQGRILCVFQPHRYTRTEDLMDRFVTCFEGADKLYLLPIYPANESPIPGITSQALADSIGSAVDVQVINVKETPGIIAGEAGEFSVIVFLGAGDIVEAADETVERLERAGGA